MSDFNQVVLTGRCGSHPEVFHVDTKPPFAKVQIATNKQWRKDNESRKRTDWHTVVFNNRLAELAEKYLHKGDKVMIRGELQTQKWQDKSGNDRLSVFVRAKELIFLTPKPAQKTQPAHQQPATEADYAEADAVDEIEEEDNLPF